MNNTVKTFNEALSNNPTLIAKELHLEQEAVTLSVQKQLEKIERHGLVDATSEGKKKLTKMIEAVSANIQTWMKEASQKRKKPTAYQYLKGISTIELAYIASKQIVNGLTLSEASLTTCSEAIGRYIRDKVEYDMFAAANPEEANKLSRTLKALPTEYQKERSIKSAMDKVDFNPLEWPDAALISIGYVLIQCTVDATNLVEIKTVRSGGITKAIIVPTEDTKEWLLDAEVKDALMLPFHYPMVVPPVPWDSLYSGGYLDKGLHRLDLVRTRNKKSLSALENIDMGIVFEGVNQIQETPWRINKKVFKVFEQLLNAQAEVAGLTYPHKAFIPPSPAPKMGTVEFDKWLEQGDNKTIYNQWRFEVKMAHKEANKSVSKNCVLEQQKVIAEKFLNEEAIYFPHTLDFRGRIYPAAGLGSVNPQGDDRGKGLLELAVGKPLGESGGFWLCVHVANTWGKDKLALEDRVLWTMYNADLMKACADDPLANLMWTEADKPWQFLQACYEFAGFMAEGDEWVSHMPIALDGSCSGLQHFAAMLKDEATAEAVNVVQTGGEPNDVYKVVAEAVKDTLSRLEDELAGIWKSRISRDIVKQNVMTTPYGVTKRGMTDQLVARAKKAIDKGDMEPLPTNVSLHEACKYLMEIVYQAIGSKVSSAYQAMDWMKECAKIAAKAELPLHWTTPTGFLAVQNYTKPRAKRVDIFFRGTRTSLSYLTQGTTLDKAKQAAGIAPNYVHSMDAAHLIDSVRLSGYNGVESFAMVHDSFGTLPSDTETLWLSLREAFLQQYKGLALEDLYEELLEQLPEDVGKKLPKPPKAGHLEIERVLDSEFFFA